MKKLISLIILLFIEGSCFAAGKINPLTGRYDLVGNSVAAAASGGYSLQPATVTIQAGSGIITTTFTISALPPGVMHIIAGSSNVATGQVSLSSEVTGNLPVTNLNSGTSASASTFWRGDGTWATASGSGDNLGNHITTMTLSALFGINASTAVFTSTGTQPAVSIVANGTYGTTAGSSGGLFIDCSGGGGASGMCAQFYTNASTQVALGGIVNIFQNLAQNTWNEPGLYIKMASTNGGAANGRFDGPAPQLEWVETDQVSPAGKYEDGVNGDIRYIAGRKGDNSAFESFVEFARPDASGGGYVNIVSSRTPVRFSDGAGTHYVSLRASGTVSSNVNFVLPNADGSANQAWVTNGAGNLFFITVATGVFAPLTMTNGVIGVDATVSQLGSSIDLSGAEATGILAAARFPALTGDVTTVAGNLTTTVVDVDAATGLLAAAQRVAVTTGTTDIAISTRIAFVAGNNITITPVVGTTSTTFTFSAIASGGASALEVFSNFGGGRSSPTASIGIGGSLNLTVTGSTGSIDVSISSDQATTQTFTNKTLDANATGNTLAWKDFFQWNNADFCLFATTNAAYTAISTQPAYGKFSYSGTASTATNSNCVMGTVPADFDTTVAMQAIFQTTNISSDTNTQQYIAVISTYADGMNVTTGTFVSPITMSIANSGQSGGPTRYRTTGLVTLTNWATTLTTSQDFTVCIQRQGDAATADASAVTSYWKELVIIYGRRQ